MTDGDITRLNRMYKCEQFEPEDVEVFKDSDSPSQQSSDETEDQNDFNTTKQRKGEGEADVLTPPRNVATGLNEIKKAAAGISGLLKQLCKYQKILQDLGIIS